jgi:hypothetical protein
MPELPSLPWETLSHRQVLAELVTSGWMPCGQGDWAVALRSPEGGLVARVCPFDPAYWAFVDLSRGCAGNRMRYALDIPYIARESSATEILALKEAWARVPG